MPWRLHALARARASCSAALRLETRLWRHVAEPARVGCLTVRGGPVQPRRLAVTQGRGADPHAAQQSGHRAAAR